MEQIMKEFQDWLVAKKSITKPDTYVSDVRTLLQGLASVDKYEMDFTVYVPALIAYGRADLAKQVLACVYADACLYCHSQKLSYFKRYCEFLACKPTKIKSEIDIKLEEAELKDIERLLEKRQVWVCDNTIARYLKRIAGDKKSTFEELLNIRIYSWQRPVFPLDTIKKILKDDKDDYMTTWVNEIRQQIKVYISKERDFIELKKVRAFDFCRGKEKTLYAIIDNKKEIVYTPFADDEKEFEPMRVTDLKDVSIDHDLPLDSIVKSILRNKNSVLKKVVEEYANDPKLEYGEMEIDKKALKKEMDEIRQATTYSLMERCENSRKSNNTNFLWFEKKGKNNIYIVADNVIGNDGETYRIYFTDKDRTKRMELSAQS